MFPFNTGDCLIEVTAWAGLTVSNIKKLDTYSMLYNFFLIAVIIWISNVFFSVGEILFTSDLIIYVNKIRV